MCLREVSKETVSYLMLLLSLNSRAEQTGVASAAALMLQSWPLLHLCDPELTHDCNLGSCRYQFLSPPLLPPHISKQLLTFISSSTGLQFPSILLPGQKIHRLPFLGLRPSLNFGTTTNHLHTTAAFLHPTISVFHTVAIRACLRDCVHTPHLFFLQPHPHSCPKMTMVIFSKSFQRKHQTDDRQTDRMYVRL